MATFPNGIKAFKPNDKAPEFVKADIIINKSELIQWLDDKDNEVKLTVKLSKGGTYYLEVNEYKPKQQ